MLDFAAYVRNSYKYLILPIHISNSKNNFLCVYVLLHYIYYDYEKSSFVLNKLV